MRNAAIALNLSFRFAGQRRAAHIANRTADKCRVSPAIRTQAGALFGWFRTRQAARRIDNIQQCTLSLGDKAGYLNSKRDLRICRHHRTFSTTSF